MFPRTLLLFVFALLFPGGASAASSVFMESLTSPEIQARLDAGTTTVIIPTGGTEQNGPHMALGKHNAIVRYAAERIATRLGNALVAPVLPYTPEGTINPPQGHMRFAGTVSLSPETFSAVLEDTARSFRQHGFTLICFLGDSGPNQQPQREVAEALTSEWEDEGVRVLSVSDYYNHMIQDEWLKRQGVKPEAIGAHAGIEDTSELMAVAPEMIRNDKLAIHPGTEPDDNGATGDATQASAERGSALLELRIDAAVNQIRAAREE